MPKSDTEKKRGRGRPTKNGVQVGLRVAPPLLDRLEAWISAQPEPRLARPEAIRELLEKALESESGADTIAAEDVNASNDE